MEIWPPTKLQLSYPHLLYLRTHPSLTSLSTGLLFLSLSPYRSSSPHQSSRVPQLHIPHCVLILILLSFHTSTSTLDTISFFLLLCFFVNCPARPNPTAQSSSCPSRHCQVVVTIFMFIFSPLFPFISSRIVTEHRLFPLFCHVYRYYLIFQADLARKRIAF